MGGTNTLDNYQRQDLQSKLVTAKKSRMEYSAALKLEAPKSRGGVALMRHFHFIFVSTYCNPIVKLIVRPLRRVSHNRTQNCKEEDMMNPSKR